METTDAEIKEILDAVLPMLNEKQRRHMVGVFAEKYGRGGISKLSQMTGMSRTTIRKAIKERKAADPEASTNKKVRKPR